MLYLTEQDVDQLLPVAAAMQAVENVLEQQGTGRAVNQPRRRVHSPSGELHVMFGAQPDDGYMGVKSYSLTKNGAQFHVMLYSMETGELLAFFEANILGQRRTGAASGIATRHLARAESRIGALFGTGWQAETQLEAMCLARPLAEVRVYSRSAENRASFCERMKERVRTRLVPVESGAAAVEGADVVTTITTAREPLFPGAALKEGAHLNVCGSNSLLKAEIDVETVRRCAIIAVDDRGAVPLECGDLLRPLESGLIQPNAIVELGEIVAGRCAGRQDDGQNTLFKSHGIALWDVAVAAHVYEQARDQGMGHNVP